MTSIADDTQWLDATAQAELVERGEVTPTELVEAAIERIERLDDELNAVIMRWFDHAREVAGNALPDGPFRGVPFLLKDLSAHYAGQPLTNGNVALRQAMPVSSADTTLVSRFRGAGPGDARPHQQPRARQRSGDRAGGLRPDPQSVERRSCARRIEWRSGSRRRLGDGADRPRLRRWRLDPDPRLVLRAGGPQALAGADHAGPFGTENGLSVQLCVSRTVRDTARLLDAVHGPGIGDTVIAPSPARPYADEVGVDPGRLRIGLLDQHPRDGVLHADCVTAVRHAAGLLESLGHDVVPGFPAVLSDEAIVRRFMVIWATMAATGIEGYGSMLGRPLLESEVEPSNWAQAEQARAISGVDYANGLAATVEFRRSIQQWWSEGWDLLLTPTLGEPPLRIGELEAGPGGPLRGLRRAGEFVPFTPPFNISGQPAINVPLWWNEDGLPIGIQLVAAYGREDVLIRIASQLEAAAPWHERHPR